MDDFADIRPYQDEEVAPVLAKLVSDPELLAALAKLKAPVLSRFFGFAVRPLLKLYLRREPVSYTHLTLPTNREV